MTAGGQTTILDIPEPQGQSHQNLEPSFGPDGKLYVHMGDGFTVARATDKRSFLGKILRINRDGSPASDNPFFSSADGISATDYLFALGFRNPFGGSWRLSDDTLLLSWTARVSIASRASFADATTCGTERTKA